jgi:GDP-L-fucose synthase
MIENNIIHQSYVHGVKKLLFLGSSCIYPGNCPQPIKEEYLLTGELEYTNEPYAIAKIAGIKLCESYNIQYGTDFVSVMPTNLYGPNDNYNLETSHVLPALIRKMHLGKCLENNDWDAIRKDFDKYPVEGVNGGAPDSNIIEKLSKYGISPRTTDAPSSVSASGLHPVSISLWGTGNPYREFLYVDDLAEACVYVMNNVSYEDLKKINAMPGSGTAIKNTHINIGTGKDLTIRDLALMVKSTVGFNGELKWDSTKPDGTFRKLLDVSKINKLGWKEKVSLEEGLEMVYKKFSES